MSLKAADSSHPGYTIDFNHFTVKSLSSGSGRKIGRFKLVYDKIVKKSSSRPVGELFCFSPVKHHYRFLMFFSQLDKPTLT